jgi:pre-mRNA-processing factor SLU7
VHISYCTGDAGKQAAAASSAQNLLVGGPPPEELSLKLSAGAGGDKGKQRRGDIDVEAEQNNLAEERKRKSRVNEGDDRFSKKTKGEEVLESKKFDVSEDDLGTCLQFVNVTHSSQVSTLSITERYRRERSRMDDPMANYVDTDD